MDLKLNGPHSTKIMHEAYIGRALRALCALYSGQMGNSRKEFFVNFLNSKC